MYKITLGQMKQKGQKVLVNFSTNAEKKRGCQPHCLVCLFTNSLTVWIFETALLRYIWYIYMLYIYGIYFDTMVEFLCITFQHTSALH